MKKTESPESLNITRGKLRRRILIVEDDKFLLNAYRVKLQKSGFEIKIAMDGEEAIEALKGYTPDLILLDLILPKKDGFAVLEELKTNENWGKIPVLIASNLGQKEDLDRGMALGAKDFVVKTDLSLDDLVKKINSFLE